MVDEPFPVLKPFAGPSRSRDAPDVFAGFAGDLLAADNPHLPLPGPEGNGLPSVADRALHGRQAVAHLEQIMLVPIGPWGLRFHQKIGIRNGPRQF